MISDGSKANFDAFISGDIVDFFMILKAQERKYSKQKKNGRVET